jgi:hypothetical protein
MAAPTITFAVAAGKIDAEAGAKLFRSVPRPAPRPVTC